MRIDKEEQPKQVDDETSERDAVYDRIYEKYGSDLSGFFRDVYKEVALRRVKAERRALDRHEAVPTR
jgi:hypothetical protein